MQPRRRDEALLDGVRRSRREPGQRRRAVDGVARARRAGASPRSAQRRAGGRRRSGRSGCRAFNLDIIYGAAGESVDDWRTHGRGGGRARPAARVGVRAHGRAGHAAGRPTRSDTPTTTTRPTSTSSSTSCSTAAGLANYEISNWARPGHECEHNMHLLAPAGLPRIRLRRPLARVWSPLVERAHARPLHRSGGRRRVDRGGGGDARRGDPSVRAARTRCCGCARACRSTHSTATPLAGPGRAIGDRWVLTRAGRLMQNEIATRLESDGCKVSR